jgi:hypothetical protein
MCNNFKTQINFAAQVVDEIKNDGLVEYLRL